MAFVVPLVDVLALRKRNEILIVSPFRASHEIRRRPHDCRAVIANVAYDLSPRHVHRGIVEVNDDADSRATRQCSPFRAPDYI